MLETIGNTHLVELEGLFPTLNARVYAKLERFNPGGSVKDRSALSMLLGKIRSGELRPGRSTVVESSSGNLAIGIAQICRYFGLRFVCVVDAKTTQQNLAILRAYQATVEVVTEPDPATGEYLPVRLRRVRELVARLPDAYWPNQYANPLNPRAHERTMAEIAEALDGRVDYLFCSASTGGTLRGAATYIRAHGLPTRIVGVDAVGSVLFGGPSGKRLIPGHGAAVKPEVHDPSAAHEAVYVSDLECVVACRTLTIREAILAGGSSGATVAALEKVAPRIPRGSTCVLVFPDGGDRYLDTIYNDEWVTAHFGEVSHLWKEEEASLC
ncbi:2,3-diaminopropionate biosynthesis protein SbnA [Phytohabitans sp. ZYX-F-186]|uniref:N-(2-amino-2-carboxyethyl)-L-glutamate synthase n=1 Tax=Phytohabitans maris TaxID=3071409 RepID=A0ABU0ZBB3_9ACTN|nr:2,3-diaminopropionate biosynthesis protein SbnA [Phytohabitans sp. ZYX-F-186]MDQ7903620.1 2,3-diaminopropionate biosynthesis protein SbnA [Phytohabitans sp. ZYX-F-186]